MPQTACSPSAAERRARMPIKETDTEKQSVSASDREKQSASAVHELNSKNVERAVRRGIKTPSVKVIGRLLLALILVVSLGMFITSLMRYGELEREKEALEAKVEYYENEIERLNYLIECPVDYDYIVRMAREKLNLHLPDEIIYYNDAN